MSRQLRIEYPGAFYHITSRGNGKQAVFLADEDRYYFINCLRDAHDKLGAIIHVYCLMNNHYHLLIETPFGNLSTVMHFINTSYTIYFNKKHERVGHLFQGRFKAILVQAEVYAHELGPYIHLNPVRAGLVDSPEKWPWSNYREYLGTRNSEPWTSTLLILGNFATKREDAMRRYADYVGWRGTAGAGNPLDAAIPSGVLGKPEFVERIGREFLIENDKEADRDLPQLRNLRPKPQMQEVLEFVSKSLGPKNKHARDAAIFVIHRNTDYRLREIGAFFKLSTSGVAQAGRRFKREIAANETLSHLVQGVENDVFRRCSPESEKVRR